MKNHNIAKNLKTTKAREKRAQIWIKIEKKFAHWSLEFFGVCLTQFRLNKILLNNLYWQPSYLLGERASFNLASACNDNVVHVTSVSLCVYNDLYVLKH